MVNWVIYCSEAFGDCSRGAHTCGAKGAAVDAVRMCGTQDIWARVMDFGMNGKCG